uniref:polynucleotide adenylyltransferase n=1 Tax=Globodera pallida TaxID=36090 RepID=A0A183BI42_GLOPA
MGEQCPLAKQTARRANEFTAKTYFAKLNNSGKSNSMHFYSITELIRQYLEVQRFFCDLSNSTVIQNVKTKIAVIIGEDYLIELDEMFPEILQIDALIPLTQTPLYKRFLESKSGTEQQLLIECRIALPLLLFRLKWFIIKSPTVKGKILDAFREKLGQIRQIAYRGLRRELTGIGQSNLARECLLRSICILHRFAGFTSVTFALSGNAKEALKEEGIRNWSPGGKCDGEEALRAAYQELHFSFAKTHCRHLTLFLRTNVLFLREFVREKRGAKNRIRKLVNGNDGFMREFRVELKDPNLFTNSRLMDDYLDAFFDQDKTTRVVGNLSVFITVWVRWMEHQFLTDDWLNRRTLEAKLVNELMWAEVKLFFEDLYDGFVDVANFDELEQKSDLLRELQRRVWEFAETKHHQRRRNEPKVPQMMALNLGRQRRKFRLNWNNLWEHWHKIVEEATRHKDRGVRLMEENREYEQWIDGLHWDMLLTLVGEDETFRENLKKGFVDDEKAKARLKDFINWEMVETLMQLLLREETTHFEKELQLIRQREGWGDREIGETEEELKRKSREENALADQRMQELIREEEHFKDVKKKMEHRHEFEGIKLIQFISDEFLYSKYDEYINKPSEANQKLLDIGTFLYEFLKENGFNDCQKELLESELLEEVKSIVSKWSDGSARLVVTGSFLLGALTPNSDIDVICIVPQRLALKEEKDKFYGALSHCDLSGPSAVGRFCEDGSLYCHFCKSEKVQSLLKIPFAQTPLLQLKFAGRDFDITFVAIPHIERLPDDPLEGADVEALSEVLASKGKAPEAMLKSFSSYLDNSRIIEVLKEKNLTKFRQLLFMLKLWAKSNQIYGNMFGFANGICLAIISAKIILWYPKSSVPFLFEKLLFVLIIWNWQVPITLINQTEGDFIWTQQSGLAPKFTEKYNNFMVISCVVSAQQHIEQFCGFVERRIRPFLLHFDQIMANFVEYSHIMPDKNLAKGNECPPKVISPQFVRTPYCKIWLVGLKLKANKIVEEYYGIGKREFRKYLNEQFINEFDTKIYNEYDVKVLRGWYQNIKLSSTFVPDSSQLTEWKLIN